MNKKLIFRMLGNILKVEAFLMLFPLIVSFIYKDGNHLSFIIPSAIMLFLGFLLTVICKRTNSNLNSKEGFITVGLSWILLSLFGSLPFLISGTIPNFFNALFETVSGYTTTGATILNATEIDTLSKSITFYRSFTHFIGGMGVLVFVIAILPKSNIQNIFILRAESTGPQVGKLTSKIKNTAIILYIIYIVLTLLETVLLVCDKNNDLFTSLTTAFGTAGTGGFSIFSSSIGNMSKYSQVVVTVFMAIFGINFNIFFLILIGRFSKAFRNEEFITYISIIIVSIISITTAEILINNLEFNNSLLLSSFHVVSFMTSTGYSNGNFFAFSAFSKSILFILMFVGACSGSTGGGFKVSRIVIVAKSVRREISRILHPKRVQSVVLDKEPLDPEIEKGVLSYTISLLVIIFISLILVSTSGLDFETNLSCTVSCINNVGLAFGKAFETTGSFIMFNDFSKVILTVLMLIGRLELYPIMILLDFRTWSNK